MGERPSTPAQPSTPAAAWTRAAPHTSGGGVRCCDAPTRRCFVSRAASCPRAPGPVDAGPGNDVALFGRADTGVDAAIDAACPAPASGGTTEVAVSAPGLAGATVSVHSWFGATDPVTLDASGSATFRAPALSVGAYGSDLALLDPIGFPVSFHLAQGSAGADVYPACIAPDPGTLLPMDRVEVILQRDIGTGLCAGSVLAVVYLCSRVTGEYTPSMFDDVPCGPFR